MTSNIYEAMENEAVEYQIFCLDRVIKGAKARATLLTSTAQIANNVLIEQHEAKRNSLIEKLNLADIDWDKIKVIQSLSDKDDVNTWDTCMMLSLCF